MAIVVRYLGRAQPKQRARVVKGQAFTPKKTREFEAAFKQLCEAAHSEAPLSSRLRVDIALNYHNKRSIGDVDNVVKSLLDAANGVLWVDDRLIDVLVVVRRFNKDLPEQAVLSVSEAT